MGNVSLNLKRYIDSIDPADYWREPECGKTKLCGRGSCEYCGALMQRWFCEQAELLFPNIKSLAAYTIVIPDLIVDFYEGDNIDLRRCTRAIREKIIKSELHNRVWLGGLDMAVDERVYGNGKVKLVEKYIVPHAMVFTEKLSKREKNIFRDCFKATYNNEDPLVETCLYSPDIFPYRMKPNFFRRVKYANAPKRSRPIKHPLSGEPLKIVRSILARHNQSDRIIAVGLRRIGNKIVVIR